MKGKFTPRAARRSVRLMCFILLLTASAASSLVMGACKEKSKRFSGIRIFYLAGGDEDNFFAQSLARGARDAADDLGIGLTILWSNWDKERILLDFKSAILAHPDGIAILGYPGERAVSPLINEARRKGIVVTSHNVDLPGLEEQWKTEGFGYVGQELRQSGRRLAAEAVRKTRADGDTVIVVIGIPGVPGRGERTLGIIDDLENEGLEYRLYDFTEELPDSAAMQRKMEDVLSQSRLWDLVLVDVSTQHFTEAMKELGIDPDSFTAAAFDISEPNLLDLEEGRLDLLLDQQPYLQGYLPVLQCAMSIRYGFSGLHILTDGSIIDRSTLNLIKPLVEEGIR